MGAGRFGGCIVRNYSRARISKCVLLRVSRKRSMISSPRTLYSIAEIEVIDTSVHPTTCLSSASRLNSPTVAHCALERTGCFCRARGLLRRMPNPTRLHKSQQSGSSEFCCEAQMCSAMKCARHFKATTEDRRRLVMTGLKKPLAVLALGLAVTALTSPSYAQRAPATSARHARPPCTPAAASPTTGAMRIGPAWPNMAKPSSRQHASVN